MTVEGYEYTTVDIQSSDEGTLVDIKRRLEYLEEQGWIQLRPTGRAGEPIRLVRKIR